MITASSSIEKQVKAFCARIGADPLLIQGAGGNVSWKDGCVLWVKASGTWLAEAELKEIFVPVKLAHLQDACARQDFSVKPEVNSNSGLRPSIETLLHALMPHRVVVHLHAVEILSHLVRVNARQKIEDLVGDAVKWIFVDYFKPGADLARAVSAKLTDRPDADIVFLANHGVVIGGNSISSIEQTIFRLTNVFRQFNNIKFTGTQPSKFIPCSLSEYYMLCPDQKLHELVLNERLLFWLRTGWALYPDHIVFLGPKACIVQQDCSSTELEEIIADQPPYIFLVGNGLLESRKATTAQRAQLACYYNVLLRQYANSPLVSLTEYDVSEILNWDAEKFRQSRSSSSGRIS